MNTNDILKDLNVIRHAVFGELGSSPNVYEDYDKLLELSNKMNSVINRLHKAVWNPNDESAEAGSIRGADMDDPVKLTFGQLRHANVERQKEWDGKAEFSELFFANALGGETGEMAEVILALQVQVAVGKAENIVKKMERGRLGLPGSTASLVDLGRELADILTYVDLLANKAGLDLASCFVNKYNEVSDKYGMASHILIDGTYHRIEEMPDNV